MVGGLFHPLNIFILGLGGGFLIPLLYRLGPFWMALAFFISLAGMAAISGVALLTVLNGAPPIEILTAGATPPLSINLRFGPWEGVFALSINLVALLGAWHLWERLRGSYAATLIFLILVTGINGMVMTRDLFNLFVFLEVMSIGTYGLLSLARTLAALAASFKYIMATVLASTFLLLGTTLLYFVTGSLNIDQLIEGRSLISGPIGIAALLMVLACLLVELKPFPANGWGLDVYETAPGGVAALISVCVSGGVFFALIKLLPLFEAQLDLIAFSGALTFIASNLIGLRQTNVQRLLGYSSIGQMGLLALALALLERLGAQEALPMVVVGLFVNHLFAKAALFWLAGTVGRERLDDWTGLTRNPLLLLTFVLALLAITGLPPFPGFWAKWELVMQLASHDAWVWIPVILAGALMESAYMFRWLGRVLQPPETQAHAQPGFAQLAPPMAGVALLVFSGAIAAERAGAFSAWLIAPLVAGALLYLADSLPGRVKCVLMLVLVLAAGIWVIRDLAGLNGLFAVLLLGGGLVIAAAGLYREDARPGFHALLAVMLLAIPALLRSSTALEFFLCWELVTLSSYFLVAYGRDAGAHLLRYILFSLGSAAFLLAGFAAARAVTGTTALAALGAAGPDATTAFVLLAIGCLIKAGALGFHVWLPGVYTQADDDLSALLSAVVSKVAIFGLLVGTYLAIRSQAGLDLAHLLAWIGMLTSIAGALLALKQDELKPLLAWSSMSQLGYIVTAIALMSHLGWVTALYLTANHMLVKGILFLSAAAIILRTRGRRIDVRGLGRTMPVTFALVVIAVLSMSGLPPFTGFGGKWLLLSAMMEKGWYALAVAGLLATFIGFLYMARLIVEPFLGTPQEARTETTEAPLTLLVPQGVLAAGLLVLTFFPKLLMEPVSRAIDPYFASTLVWEGMSLETIYGYWNPVPVMAISVAVAAVLFAIFRVIYMRGSSTRNLTPGPALARFRVFYAPLLDNLSPPLAAGFWTGFASALSASAEGARKVYTGDARTYALHILFYFIALYGLNLALG